jgi:hypothetical protein
MGEEGILGDEGTLPIWVDMNGPVGNPYPSFFFLKSSFLTLTMTAK